MYFVRQRESVVCGLDIASGTVMAISLHLLLQLWMRYLKCAGSRGPTASTHRPVCLLQLSAKRLLLHRNKKVERDCLLSDSFPFNFCCVWHHEWHPAKLHQVCRFLRDFFIFYYILLITLLTADVLVYFWHKYSSEKWIYLQKCK